MDIQTSYKNRFESNPEVQNIVKGNQTLKLGDQGETVKLVQQTLIDMGFYVGDNSADGKFGKQTEIALKNFQNSRGLKETGILDQNTMKELFKIAPPEGKKLWDKDVAQLSKELIPSNEVFNKNRAKVVVDLSEHRLFLFDDNNNLEKIYPVATGKDTSPTTPGVKKVVGKLKDPTPVALRLWPESGGKAFGTRLLDLSFVTATGKEIRNGQELHGTYANISIGTNASYGCIRMLNKDIEEIYPKLKVGDLIKIQK